VTENLLALRSIDTLGVRHRRDAYATLDAGNVHPSPLDAWRIAQRLKHLGCSVFPLRRKADLLLMSSLSLK
jgi:hypothetical protein